MTPIHKILLVFTIALALPLCATLAHSGLGQCALCDCKAFAGGKSTNWRCACKHHYDHHYNNRKGPSSGLRSLPREQSPFEITLAAVRSIAARPSTRRGRNTLGSKAPDGAL
ncbi:MAG: hypothetical protein FWG59_06930 [Betaproteobacteria bacterium]|nr:hypothetical protein [Betaproteobacteria bacterium]